MQASFDTKARFLTPLGLLLPIACVIGGSRLLLSIYTPGELATWFYESAEWLAPAFVVVLLALVWITDQFTTRNIRPLTHVPPEGWWWEFLVIGAFGSSMIVLLFLSAGGVLILLPIILPIKAIVTYALGPGATLASAIVALPMAYFGVGLAFALLYVVVAATGKGNVTKDGAPLFPGSHQAGYLPAVGDTLFFSLATMLGSDTGGLAVTGTLRWVTLAQATAAKAIEIAIVGVGITLILNRLP
jgi:hypothetical protein